VNIPYPILQTVQIGITFKYFVCAQSASPTIGGLLE